MLDPTELDRPRAVLVGLVVVVVLAVGVAAGTSTAAFGTYKPAWNGTADLRALADDRADETQILPSTDEYGSVDAPGSITFVVSPDRAYAPEETDLLRAFVVEGGTLVVAEDFGNHSNDLLAGVGASARVDGRLLRDERFNYRSPAMPIARNASRPSAAGGDRLILNHGTAVEPNGADALVSTSGFAYPDANRNGRPDPEERLNSYPIVTVEAVGDGRVIVVGDPSVAGMDRPTHNLDVLLTRRNDPGNTNGLRVQVPADCPGPASPCTTAPAESTAGRIRRLQTVISQRSGFHGLQAVEKVKLKSLSGLA